MIRIDIAVSWWNFVAAVLLTIMLCCCVYGLVEYFRNRAKSKGSAVEDSNMDKKNEDANKVQNKSFSYLGLVVCTLINVLCMVAVLYALCHSYPRTQNLAFDYSGVIVAILSILITVLITWQISTNFDVKAAMKREREATEAALKKAQTDVLENNQKAQISFYSTLFQEKAKIPDVYASFTYGIWTLYYCIPFREYEAFCDVVIKAMKELSGRTTFSAAQKAELIRISEPITKSWIGKSFEELYGKIVNEM